MDDSNKYQQMQDEMSRFEAEISGEHGLRGVISAGTFGAVQQRLERAIPPPPPPPALLPAMPFDQSMGPRMMFPAVPPPPPPPNMPHMMIPASVQRLRPDGMPQFPMFLRPGMPGPQLAPPPPPRPQPVVLSAAPKLYKQPKQDDKEKPSKKRKRSPPPIRAPSPPRAPTPPPAPTPTPMPTPTPTPVAVAVPAVVPDAAPKAKKEKKHRKKKCMKVLTVNSQNEFYGFSLYENDTKVTIIAVVRTAGGQVWEDVTLLDWPDDDFRMFCGDLGNDVTDELLTRTFSKYTSFQRAKVIRDKRTNKSKGFGFVSFKDPGDFIKAMKEMDGRYVGSRPIKLRKSTWKNRALDVVRKKEKEKAALLSLLMAGNKS